MSQHLDPWRFSFTRKGLSRGEPLDWIRFHAIARTGQVPQAIENVVRAAYVGHQKGSQGCRVLKKLCSSQHEGKIHSAVADPADPVDLRPGGACNCKPKKHWTRLEMSITDQIDDSVGWVLILRELLCGLRGKDRRNCRSALRSNVYSS